MTSLIYCQECAAVRGYPLSTWDAATNNYTGIPYQQTKFADHTISGHRTGSRPVSVLRDPTYANYIRLMKETIESGFCEIDASSRLNLILRQGTDIGDKLVGGSAVQAQDLFKAVKTDTATGAHGFSYRFPGTGIPFICLDCGRAF